MAYRIRGLPVRDYAVSSSWSQMGTSITWTGRFAAPRGLATPLRWMLTIVARGLAGSAADAAGRSEPVTGVAADSESRRRPRCRHRGIPHGYRAGPFAVTARRAAGRRTLMSGTTSAPT